MSTACHESSVTALDQTSAERLFPEGEKVRATVGTCSVDGGGSLLPYAVITLPMDMHHVYRCDELTKDFPHHDTWDDWSVFITRQGRTVEVRYNEETIHIERIRKPGPFTHTF